MSDLVNRLRGYNPPDRTVDEQRQIAQDIHDAAAEIERLAAYAEGLEADASRYRFLRDLAIHEDGPYCVIGACGQTVPLFGESLDARLSAFVERNGVGHDSRGAFLDWWSADGHFIDPDSEANWHDKRHLIADEAWHAALKWADSRTKSGTQPPDGIYTDEYLLGVLRGSATISTEAAIAAADRIEEYCRDAAVAEEALERLTQGG